MSLCTCDPEKELNFDCFTHGPNHKLRARVRKLESENETLKLTPGHEVGVLVYMQDQEIANLTAKVKGLEAVQLAFQEDAERYREENRKLLARRCGNCGETAYSSGYVGVVEENAKLQIRVNELEQDVEAARSVVETYAERITRLTLAASEQKSDQTQVGKPGNSEKCPNDQ